MKAWVLESFNTPYKLRSDVPVPKPDGPYDVLIKVDAAGYCHTDAVLAAGQFPLPPKLPMVGSHEIAGTVVEADPSTGLKPGDRVGSPGRNFHPCGECDECRKGPGPDGTGDPVGYSNYCPVGKSNGIARDGGFQEYLVVDARQVAKFPEQLTAVEVAPLMCAGITIYEALKKCRLQPGQRVAIMGCGGGLGHLGLQFATKMGLKVIGVDASDGPLAIASSLDTGAEIVDARVTPAMDIVKRLGQEDGKKYRGEMGVDAAIILPENQRAFQYGVDLLRNHGTCLVVSFPEKGFHFAASDVIFRDIRIIGTQLGTSRRVKEMLDFVVEHGVKTLKKVYEFDRLDELVEEYERGGGGKLVLDLSASSVSK
ncbi:hypothetical protein AYO20_03223 [Fonsecaea nubica]|uniref:Enoyl reductase (ER) domain-containing protein n=1 Tax=Fonsecaea nubica TaxID=856822 RepID=A0A178D7M6_9EURO|nr:hypothetical protein AYO20_03223 [Fonsecaea nubica]OAL37374.1 hypothetical protein AYO20_03223 [Fonsecaea nubica]